MLVNQPTKWPTRKLVAVIIAGAVTGALQSAGEVFLPDLPLTELLSQIDAWVQLGVMALAGYMTRDRA